jgi:hypothetical protein
LQAAEFVLLGLRHPAELIGKLLKGVTRMEASSTYQAILAKGMTRGLEKGIEKGLAASILRSGRHQFQTEAPPQFVQRLNAITDVRALEAIEDRLLEVASWDELITE